MEKVKGLTLEQWIKQETAPRKRRLWGDEVEFSPVLCGERLGDGQQLVYLGTIDQRPYYWLILIDSKTDVTSDDFDLEDILQPLEECFGRSDPEDDVSDYPTISWDGGHWGVIVNMTTGFFDNI